MAKPSFCMLCGALVWASQLWGQQVIVERDENSKPITATAKRTEAVAQSLGHAVAAKQEPGKAQPLKSAAATSPITAKSAAPDEKARPEPEFLTVAKTPGVTTATAGHPSPTSPKLAGAVTGGSPKPQQSPGILPAPHTMRLTRVEGPAPEQQPRLPLTPQESESLLRPPLESAFVRLADGFDFPVGKPEAQGYYKARGFRSHGHLGEDWDGIRGGDTDLRDPIYCIGNGIVVFARDCHMGWGNVLIVRHSYRDGGVVRNIDSLYGHLDRILVRRGQLVSRGQQIATMGNAHGLYDAHLHLEIRKNIEIGMSRAKFAQDFSNYYDPTQFINQHRHLQGGGGSYRVAMNTFVQDSRINWAAVRNYSHSRYRGGTRESSTVLKKAVVRKN
jgi:murein DD-endopeptidase MepM/ murein hydrolase activator NlpD